METDQIFYFLFLYCEKGKGSEMLSASSFLVKRFQNSSSRKWDCANRKFCLGIQISFRKFAKKLHEVKKGIQKKENGVKMGCTHVYFSCHHDGNIHFTVVDLVKYLMEMGFIGKNGTNYYSSTLH